MPSYKQTLKQTYFPVQEASAAWTAAKASAGADFSSVEAERKALAEIRAARTRYAENLRPRESNDAFVMAALGGLAKSQVGLDAAPGGKFVYQNDAFDEAMVQARLAAKKAPSPTKLDVENIIAAAKAAITIDERSEVDALAKQAGGNATTRVDREVPRPKKTKAQIVSGNDAESKKIREGLIAQVSGAKTLLEQAQSSGAMGFEGGEGGKKWYKGLSEDQQRMLSLYQSALEDDGVVSPGEIPGDVAEAAKLFKEAKIQGGYRRKDRALYDPSYLRMLQEETKAAADLAEKESRIEGKTVEGLSLELYQKMRGEEGRVDPMTGLPLQEASKVPPLLRSLQGDISSILMEHEKTGAEALAVPQNKAVQSALKLKAGGMSAKAISAEMTKAGLPASDIRKALAFIAAEEIVRTHKAEVAPGTDDKTLEKIGEVNAEASKQKEIDRIAEAKKAAINAQRQATSAKGQDTIRAIDTFEQNREKERQRLSESGLVRDRLKAKFGRRFQKALELPPTPPSELYPRPATEPRMTEEEVNRRIEANLSAEPPPTPASPPPTPEPPRFEMVFDEATGDYVRKQVGG